MRFMSLTAAGVAAVMITGLGAALAAAAALGLLPRGARHGAAAAVKARPAGPASVTVAGTRQARRVIRAFECGPSGPASLWGLVMGSDVIAIGTVTEDLGGAPVPTGAPEAHEPWMGIVTRYRVRVEKYLPAGGRRAEIGAMSPEERAREERAREAGEPRMLTLRLRGGIAGDLEYVVIDGPARPVVGERYLLFLKGAEPGVRKRGHHLLGYQGKWYPNGDADEVWPVDTLKGIVRLPDGGVAEGLADEARPERARWRFESADGFQIVGATQSAIENEIAKIVKNEKRLAHR